MDGVFALYRNPYASEYTFVRQSSGGPSVLHSYEELAGKSGFVFAPFRISAECPLLLISPEWILTKAFFMNVIRPVNATGMEKSLRVFMKNSETGIFPR